jgi:hypothetical protein
MRVTPIPPQQQPVVPWRNGAGSTREVLRVGPADGFDWRASVAFIDASGPFSPFPGYRRWSCLLDGGPLTLAFPDGARLALLPRMCSHAYAGDPAPAGDLDGPFATVFNLIAAQGRCAAQLLPRPLVGSMLLFDQAHRDWLIFLISGQAELRLADQRHPLQPQHALWLQGQGDGTRAVLEGGGEVVLARIDTVGDRL